MKRLGTKTVDELAAWLISDFDCLREFDLEEDIKDSLERFDASCLCPAQRGEACPLSNEECTARCNRPSLFKRAGQKVRPFKRGKK